MQFWSCGFSCYEFSDNECIEFLAKNQKAKALTKEYQANSIPWCMFLFIRPSITSQGAMEINIAIYKFARPKYLRARKTGKPYKQMKKKPNNAPNAPLTTPSINIEVNSNSEL
jgi:hypothetical protein